MGTEIEFIPRIELLTCPFMEKCELPKLQFLCKIPDCKNCTEYNDWLKKQHKDLSESNKVEGRYC